MVRRLLFFAIVLILAVMISEVSADLMIRQVTNTEAFEMMGQKQEAESDTAVIWMAEGRAYMELAGSSFIFRADESVLYTIDPAAGSYYQVPVGGDQSDGDSAAVGEAAMMKKMMASVKVQITETEETRKIGNWNCNKYLVEIGMPMGTGKMEIWATEDIEADYSLFLTIAETELTSQPGMGKIREELKKIRGIQVQSRTEIKIMGVSIVTTTEIIECSEQSAPEGIYDIPEDFIKGEQPAGGMGF